MRVLFFASSALLMGFGLGFAEEESAAPGPRGHRHYVSANDGNALETYWVTPEGEPPAEGWPCLIHLHGYSRGMNPVIADQSADDGYVGIVFSARGNAGSEGYNTFGWREVFDVRDMISYAIAHLPVNPERIGLTGGSFGGFRGIFAAVIDKRIRTVVAGGFPAWSSYGFIPNNVPVAFPFYSTEARSLVRSLGSFEERNRLLIQGRFAEAAAVANLTSVLPFSRDIECPVFLGAGMMDIIVPPQDLLALYDALYVPKKIHIGAGGHESGPFNDETEARRGAELQKRWLAYWLKDEANGILDEPGVYYPIRPGWEPVAAEEFPGRDVEGRLYHLVPGEKGGALSPEPKASELETSLPLVNKLADPGWNYARAYEAGREASQGKIEDDTLVFETGPLETAALLLGAPNVNLMIHPESGTWQVYAALYDAPPEGEPELVTMMPLGIVADAPIPPTDHNWSLRSVAYRFPAGHRIRLELRNHGEPLFLPYYTEFSCDIVFREGFNDNWLLLPIAAE